MKSPLRVYKLCSQIPTGQVSTYKYLSVAAYGSPHYSRVVGKILSQCGCVTKTNFRDFSCETIHCYRVINSNFSLGGFATGRGEGSWPEIKRKKLASEGIFFNDRGYLVNNLREKIIFNDFHE